MDEDLLKGEIKVGAVICLVVGIEILNSILYLNQWILNKGYLNAEKAIQLAIVDIRVMLTICVSVFFYRGYKCANSIMIIWLFIQLIIWGGGIRFEEFYMFTKDISFIRWMYMFADIFLIAQLMFSKYIYKFMNYKRKQYIDEECKQEYLLEDLVMKQRTQNFITTVSNLFFTVGFMISPFFVLAYGWASIIIFTMLFIIYRAAFYRL